MRVQERGKPVRYEEVPGSGRIQHHDKELHRNY